MVWDSVTHLWLSIWSCKVATLTFLFWVWLNQLRGGVGTRKHWTIKNYHAYHEENADMAHNSLIGLNVHSNIIDIPYDCSTVFVEVFHVFLVDGICLRQSRTEDGPPLPPTSFLLYIFHYSLWYKHTHDAKLFSPFCILDFGINFLRRILCSTPNWYAKSLV